MAPPTWSVPAITQERLSSEPVVDSTGKVNALLPLGLPPTTNLAPISALEYAITPPTLPLPTTANLPLISKDPLIAEDSFLPMMPPAPG